MAFSESGYSYAKRGREIADTIKKTAKLGSACGFIVISSVISFRRRRAAGRYIAKLTRDAAQEWVVVRGAHKEQHRERQPEPHTRCNESPPRQALGLGRHRHAVLGGIACPAED